MHKLVLVRHGESQWNKENRFTGWTDVDITEKGLDEAFAAGELLKKEGYDFDLVFTSVLKRAIRTMWCILDKMDRMWLPIERAWQLNERHYGALQGLNKSETAETHGADQVLIWRRSYDIPPPALETSDDRHPSKDSRYKGIDVPSTEALKQCLERVLPYWDSQIVPRIKEGKKILIVAHGNSLRALVKHLDGISDDEITSLNIPTGIPLVYELDDQLKPIQSYYLGDQEKAAAAAKAVAEQAKQ